MRYRSRRLYLSQTQYMAISLYLLVKCHWYIVRWKKKKKQPTTFGPNGHIFSPNFGIKALFSSVWVPLLSAQK